MNFRRALATFHFALGEVPRGVAVLEEIVARWPGNVWGYVALGDAFSDTSPEAMAPPVDLARARAWLAKGLHAVPASERAVLEERLTFLEDLAPET